MSNKPQRIRKVRLKMLTISKWMDTPRDPIIYIEKVGQIMEVTEQAASVVIESGKGVLYKGNKDHGEVDKLNKDEQAMADAFELERMAREEAKAKAVAAAKVAADAVTGSTKSEAA